MLHPRCCRLFSRGNEISQKNIILNIICVHIIILRNETFTGKEHVSLQLMQDDHNKK
ncbi:hypothetical protein Hanom_Chr08g00729891 [Helianthus anomalus]